MVWSDLTINNFTISLKLVLLKSHECDAEMTKKRKYKYMIL